MKIYLPNIRLRTAIIFSGVILAAVFAFWATVQLLVDAGAVRDKLAEAVKRASGYEVEVQGAELDVFPLPSVILSSVAITNPSSSTESYLFEASSLRLHLDPVSLFKGELRPSVVDVAQATLNLEKYSQDQANWKPLLPLFEGLNGQGRLRVNFIDSSVYYQDTVSQHDESVESLQGYAELGRDGLPHLNLTFIAFDAPGSLSFDASQGRLSSYHEFELQSVAEIRFGDEYIFYDGQLSQKAAGPLLLKGVLRAEAQQSRVWFERLSRSKAQDGAFSALPETLPFRLETVFDTREKRGSIILKDFTLGESKGNGTVSWVAKGQSPQVEGEFLFSKLNADELLGGEGNINAFFSLFLPIGVEGVFTANAKELIYQGVPLANVQMTSSLLQGEMNINQLAAALPGKTRLLAFGIMKRDTRGQINFDGSAEMLGEDASLFLKDSGFQKVNVIPQARSKFRARANVFLSADRGTISELRFQGGDFYVVGGINLNAGGKHDIETTLRFRNVRLEPLADFFAPLTAKVSTTDERTLDRKLPWLNSIRRSVYLNLLFEDFSLGDKKGVRSQFIVSIAKGSVNFQKIDMNFQDSRVQGMGSFEQVSGEVPKVTAELSLTKYDLNSLLGKDFIQHPVPRGNQAGVWSTEPFETSFLRGYDAVLAIRVDEAAHESFSMRNLQFKARSTNGDWQVEDLSADLWNGKLNGSGRLDVSSVPSFNAVYQMANIEVQQAMKSIAGFESLRGRASISAEFKSSGISPAHFVKNASGTMAFSGRDITIRGFDIASLVQTVPSVRSVADVVNTARIATLKGASSFNIVDGGFYFSQGSLGTQGITFRSRHALGAFGGAIDLMRWAINAQIQFKLISIVSEEYPTVSVLFRDSMDSPVIDLDTRSLEAWVARQKLLQ